MSLQFPCTKCGACCRTVGFVSKRFREIPDEQLTPLEKEFKYFPYKTANGVCEKYDAAIGCTIYEQRPSVCSIEKTYERHFKGSTPEDFIAANKKACAVIIDSLGLSPSLKP